jgi:hypothetical protein
LRRSSVNRPNQAVEPGADAVLAALGKPATSRRRRIESSAITKPASPSGKRGRTRPCVPPDRPPVHGWATLPPFIAQRDSPGVVTRLLGTIGTQTPRSSGSEAPPDPSLWREVRAGGAPTPDFAGASGSALEKHLAKGGGLSARHDPSLPLKRKAVAVDASADRKSERPGRGVPGLFASSNRASWVGIGWTARE